MLNIFDGIHNNFIPYALKTDYPNNTCTYDSLNNVFYWIGEILFGIDPFCCT